MQLSAASDLGLLCLHMSHKKDARLILVNLLYSDFFVGGAPPYLFIHVIFSSFINFVPFELA